MPETKRIIILGGGFAGTYAALELERTLAKDSEIEVLLVNKENYFLFTPMLHEVAASDLDPTNIVSPIHSLLRRVQFFCGTVESIDLSRRVVVLAHGYSKHIHEIPYDQLVLALGSVTNFYQLPGVMENALTMKTLGDAMYLRNQLIALLEEANFECSSAVRQRLLTFVVSGGGFAGVETIASLRDFLHEALHFYPNLRPEMLKVVLVHSGQTILPELGEKLGRYAQEKLARRGVEILTGSKVMSYTNRLVKLSSGEELPSDTLVWTAGTSPNPLLATLSVRRDHGRVVVNKFLEVEGNPGVWALGDCALIPDKTHGGYCPPTAQHALREGRILAWNIRAVLRDGEKKAFKFPGLGQLAAIGHRTGVASILGFHFSGFIAWFLWRTVYLLKLPRLQKKFRVALDWTLDLIFSKDPVQYMSVRGTDSAAGQERLSEAA